MLSLPAIGEAQSFPPQQTAMPTMTPEIQQIQLEQPVCTCLFYTASRYLLQAAVTTEEMVLCATCPTSLEY